MLRRSILLDFENVRSWQDPVFFLILFCFGTSCLHFVLSWFMFKGDHGPEEAAAQGLQAQLKDIMHSDALLHFKESALTYIAPAAIFVAFCAQAYDIEATLLPLSKYWEQDPARARDASAEMVVIREPATIAAATELRREQSVYQEQDRTVDETYRELANRALRKGSDVEASVSALTVSTSTMKRSLWPAIVLLDPRLVDDESKELRRYWRYYICATALVCCVVFAIFALQTFR